ncbi:MAG: DUF1028 domain-containing protein [Planctomycetota bacterium]
MKTLLARLRGTRSAALFLAAALVLAPPARSTWSIVAVDTRTGEVVIAAATCLNLDLRVYLPVIRVGVGGACAQSAVDGTGQNRLMIWNGLQSGLTAEQIMAVLLAAGPQTNRQYGIATLQGEPVTFDGAGVGNAHYGVARTIDGVSYAIQGNVLSGIQVITHAENAFLATQGDLSQRVMAAMEGARVYGGDGRCSCLTSPPTSCGCPPSSFLIADLTAYLIAARMGDVDGICNAGGCATGTYFCNLNTVGVIAGVDPVVRLQSMYTDFRASRLGRTDQLRTLVTPRSSSLPADSTSEVQVEVELRDIEGNPVADAAATISIDRVYSGPPLAKIVAVERLDASRFRITIRSRDRVGEARWRITSHQNGVNVLIWPELVVQIVPA